MNGGRNVTLGMGKMVMHNVYRQIDTYIFIERERERE